MVNQTKDSIYFRIRSNNNQYYEIKPQQDILAPRNNINILFKLKTKPQNNSSIDNSVSKFKIMSKIV